MPSAEMPATSGDSTQRLAARTPLRIAAVVDTECDPGQEALAWRRLSALAATGCDIEAFTIDASRAFEVKLADEGMVVRRLGRQLHADWPSVRDLAAATRHSQHRAIYCMGPRAHARAAVAASMLQVPAVIHPYAMPSFGDLSIARTTGSTLFVSTDASLGHARLAGCDALLVRTPVRLETRERLEPSDRKTLQRPACVGWIGAWRDANNPALFERAAGAIGRERRDLSFVMVALGASPPRAASGSRITVTTAHEFEPGHLAKIGVLVHTGFDDGCPIAWMQAYVRGMSLVLPVDGFVDAFVRASEAHFYSSGYLNELIAAIAAAVDSSAPPTPGPRHLDASAESSASIRTALDQVVSHR